MYVYLLIPLRVTRISSRFWIFPLFSCIYYLLLFLHYFLHISCSCCLFYFLPYPTFFISFLSSYSVLLYSLSLSLVLSPPLSTSVSLSFIIFSLSSLFLSSPPRSSSSPALHSFLTLSISVINSSPPPPSSSSMFIILPLTVLN